MSLVRLLFGSTIVIEIIIGLNADRVKRKQEHLFLPSKLGRYEKAAVVSDSVYCADAGKEMMLKNGSAVDTMIATLLCMGVYNGQSSGIGGGFFMTIYERATKTATVIDARETAPAEASEDMYEDDPDLAFKGGLSVAVPGEIKGMETAHQRYGKLGWAVLFQPAIRLARDGFSAGMHLARALRNQRDIVLNSTSLRAVFVNPKTNDVFKQGDWVMRSKLAETLERIATNGADEFYTGETGKNLVQDIKDQGGIITLNDMENYKPRIKKAMEANLQHGLTMYSVPPPGSGYILGFILKVLDLYNMSALNLSSLKNSYVTYQRYVEALKYGYALRTQLGDEDFVNMTEIISKLESDEVARLTQKEIKDNMTFEPKHYGALSAKDDYGTAHAAVMTPNGDAVSATNTINYWFGAGFISPSTGIILNNEMDDFSAPHIINKFDLPPSVPNFIRPGKRPLSSMCPAIFVDDNGDVVLVIGAAGGSRITSAVALVSMKTLWLERDIKSAIDDPRIHHQLFPNSIEYETLFPEDILQYLQDVGHKFREPKPFGSVVVGITRTKNGTLSTNYDYRKGGSSAGF